jgi:hypothetical protein
VSLFFVASRFSVPVSESAQPSSQIDRAFVGAPVRVIAVLATCLLKQYRLFPEKT